MFDPIIAADPIEQPAKAAQVYDRWRVARLVIEHTGEINYNIRRANEEGELAPLEVAQPVFGHIEDFQALLSSDKTLWNAAKVLFAALKQHAEASGQL